MGLADVNNDGFILLKEFMAALKRDNVAINAEELLFIYDFTDQKNKNKDDGKINYLELVDVLKGRK